MGFSSSTRDDDPKADINVTPLVDVMLVLLVIFMVTAPMMQQGVEVELPKATTAPLKGSNEQVVISVDKNGKVFVGAGNETPIEEIGPKIKAIMENRKEEDKKVYIKGDTNTNYGVVMQVMGRLHEGGIYQIGLMSGQPESKK